jgi:hypothetical protein
MMRSEQRNADGRSEVSCIILMAELGFESEVIDTEKTELQSLHSWFTRILAMKILNCIPNKVAITFKVEFGHFLSCVTSGSYLFI